MANPLGQKASNATAWASADLDRMPLDLVGQQPVVESSAPLTLTTAMQRPTGCFWTTPRAGRWLVLATFDMNLVVGSGGGNTDSGYGIGQLFADGTAFGLLAVANFTRGNGNQYPSSLQETVMAVGITPNLAAQKVIESKAGLLFTSSGNTVMAGHTKLVVIEIAA